MLNNIEKMSKKKDVNDILNNNLEFENEEKIDELTDRVNELKSLSLDI